jgi:serine protease Do
MNDLRNRIAATAPGSKTTFEIFRKGHSQTLSVEIARMESETPVAASQELMEELGMVLSDITPDAARALGLKDSDGVLVTSIDPTGAAARSGLRPNDVTVSVNGATTANVAGARSAVAPQMAWLNGPMPALGPKRRHSGPCTLTVSNPELICV